MTVYLTRGFTDTHPFTRKPIERQVNDAGILRDTCGCSHLMWVEFEEMVSPVPLKWLSLEPVEVEA